MELTGGDPANIGSIRVADDAAGTRERCEHQLSPQMCLYSLPLQMEKKTRNLRAFSRRPLGEWRVSVIGAHSLIFEELCPYQGGREEEPVNVGGADDDWFVPWGTRYQDPGDVDPGSYYGDR